MPECATQLVPRSCVGPLPTQAFPISAHSRGDVAPRWSGVDSLPPHGAQTEPTTPLCYPSSPNGEEHRVSPHQSRRVRNTCGPPVQEPEKQAGAAAITLFRSTSTKASVANKEALQTSRGGGTGVAAPPPHAARACGAMVPDGAPTWPARTSFSSSRWRLCHTR